MLRSVSHSIHLPIPLSSRIKTSHARHHPSSMTTLASPMAHFASPGSSSSARSRSPGSSSLASLDYDSHMLPPSKLGPGGDHLERISSHPSLTHSASSIATHPSEHEMQTESSVSGSELMTPLDKRAFSPPLHIQIMDEREREREMLSPVSVVSGGGVTGNKSLRGGFTKSMQNLRGRSPAAAQPLPRSQSGERMIAPRSM